MDASQLDSSLNESVTDTEGNLSETSPPASTQESVTAELSDVTVVQLPDGQTVQVQGVVQGVIQAPQPSVIQSPQVQTVQIATVAELDDEESAPNAQKRREILSRRPSYRKILNELSSDSPAVPKIDEEKAEDEVQVSSSAASSAPASIYQTSSGQYIAIGQGGTVQLAGPEALQGAQVPQPGATISTPQQLYVQGRQVLIQGGEQRRLRDTNLKQTLRSHPDKKQRESIRATESRFLML